MRPVTKPGEQPPTCVLEDCDAAPVAGDVHCAAHLRYMQTHNGTATGPPVTEPDDPALLEREAKKARELEEREYAERRRVKTWRTNENGTRTPETYFTDEELAEFDARAQADVAELGARIRTPEDRPAPAPRYASKVTTPSHTWEFDPSTGEHIPGDPTKAAAKLFRRALRGKCGPSAQKMAEAFVDYLRDQPTR